MPAAKGEPGNPTACSNVYGCGYDAAKNEDGAGELDAVDEAAVSATDVADDTEGTVTTRGTMTPDDAAPPPPAAAVVVVDKGEAALFCARVNGGEKNGCGGGCSPHTL